MILSPDIEALLFVFDLTSYICFADAEHDWNITAHNGFVFRQKTLPPRR
jgi:hypothetical protein